MCYAITKTTNQKQHNTMKAKTKKVIQMIAIGALTLGLVSCDAKKFEVPVGYMTVPVYASDIEKYKAESEK